MRWTGYILGKEYKVEAESRGKAQQEVARLWMKEEGLKDVPPTYFSAMVKLRKAPETVDFLTAKEEAG